MSTPGIRIAATSSNLESKGGKRLKETIYIADSRDTSYGMDQRWINYSDQARGGNCHY
jgi:hypothetical protein